ncbi:MAG: hypothetical protein A3F72_15585 [Bacteroidetes bacterium RIFCSPLOWO2_12_FULL_35_15]|nr:MAG: hypothetical protein A3F72_15585 [Bacteroidetes bacterium RIFCSPLOWO2_12_FULL_35_15]
MENYRVESELSGIRCDVVVVGAAIVGALLLNAFILVQIANDLHDLRKVQRLKVQNDLEEEVITATDKVPEEQPVKEQQPANETKAESEIKTENEKQ